jgi:hypothetical protein
MPKPYSYDLRQKAIQAIKLDRPKISFARQQFNARVATPLTYGFRGKPKLGTPFALPNQPKGNGDKITAGGTFSSGKLKPMAIKPKSRVPDCGRNWMRPKKRLPTYISKTRFFDKRC